jgi:hypothetical protein
MFAYAVSPITNYSISLGAFHNLWSCALLLFSTPYPDSSFSGSSSRTFNHDTCPRTSTSPPTYNAIDDRARLQYLLESRLARNATFPPTAHRHYLNLPSPTRAYTKSGSGMARAQVARSRHTGRGPSSRRMCGFKARVQRVQDRLRTDHHAHGDTSDQHPQTIQGNAQRRRTIPAYMPLCCSMSSLGTLTPSSTWSSACIL